MVKVKYTGLIEGETMYVGVLQPGDEVEVNKDIAEFLLRGNFELVKKDKKVKED